jgi:hypothetical protein
LHLNEWTQSEDRLVSVADLEAAAVLGGELDPLPNLQYLISVDLGLVNDKTVVAIAHAEATSVEPGSPKRVVIDSLKRWRGKRLRPVQIGEVEAYIALTAKRYNNARVIADPWQAAGMIQRLKAQGVRCEPFPFTITSTGRIGQALHLALRNHLLWIPDDEELLSELARVRLRETGIGQARLDHDSGDHDDQAVALAMLCGELIGNAQPSGLAAFFEREHPMHTCGMPNPRSATKCSKCDEQLTPPPEPEPSDDEMAAVAPWASSEPQRQPLPGEAAVNRTLDMLTQARKQGAVIDFGLGPFIGRGR